MQTNQDALGRHALPADADSTPRSPLRTLFFLILGIVYPAFLALIFLRPDLPEILFQEFSVFVICGLALSLPVLCLVLASAHFRAADRQYRDSAIHSITTQKSSGGNTSIDHEP